ncbi:MAG: large repetitive protein [Frankiaceae bacterium]|jgi:DNA-binding beta-propeller fold protein YncE|nr:large repetitive protein [Frankiaceae bacterium]
MRRRWTWALGSLLVATALVAPVRATAHGTHEPRANASSTHYLFAPNFSSNVVSVFDLQTNKLIKYIDVQAKGPCCAHVTHDGKTVMVVDGFSPYVTTIDVGSLAVRRLTQIGNTIGDIGSDIQRGDRTFYANDLPFGNVYAIDIASGKVRKTFPDLGHFFVSRDGRTLYSANPVSTSSSELDAWSTRTGRKLGSVMTSGGSTLMMLRDNRHLYVQGNDIDVIDVSHPRHMRNVRTIAVGTAGWVGQLTPDGSQYWIPGEDDGYVTVVDTRLNKVVKRIALGAYGGGIDFSRNGRAYVAVSNQPIAPVSGTAGAFSYLGVAPGAALGIPSTTYRPGIDPPGEIYVYDTHDYTRIQTPPMKMPSISFVLEVVDNPPTSGRS